MKKLAAIVAVLTAGVAIALALSDSVHAAERGRETARERNDFYHDRLDESSPIAQRDSVYNPDLSEEAVARARPVRGEERLGHRAPETLEER